jgi:hypothetical protein
MARRFQLPSVIRVVVERSYSAPTWRGHRVGAAVPFGTRMSPVPSSSIAFSSPSPEALLAEERVGVLERGSGGNGTGALRSAETRW